MHWCFNINALQRPFFPLRTSSCCLGFFLHQKSVFPQWNIVSCLLGRRFPAVTAVFLADSNSGRKEDVEREWIECWIHISTPLPHLCVSLTYSTLGIPRYHTLHLADPVTKRIKMCNKTSLIYSIYTQQVGRNTSNMIPGHIWSHEGVSLFLFWVDGQAGGFPATWLQVAYACSVVLQKQNGTLLQRRKGWRGSD